MGDAERWQGLVGIGIGAEGRRVSGLWGDGLIPVRCKEFLNASWWYCVGPPPAFGGRRPHAEAAASPQGWPPPLAAPPRRGGAAKNSPHSEGF
jgi:hypothetical protein